MRYAAGPGANGSAAWAIWSSTRPEEERPERGGQQDVGGRQDPCHHQESDQDSAGAST